MPRRIDYYFSLQSPWAYIGHALFRDVVARHGAEVACKPVLLVDLFAETGGLPLKRRHPVRKPEMKPEGAMSGISLLATLIATVRANWKNTVSSNSNTRAATGMRTAC